MDFNFVNCFNSKIGKKNLTWEVSALAAPDGTLYSLGSDSKLIGRIFELISFRMYEKALADHDTALMRKVQRRVIITSSIIIFASILAVIVIIATKGFL